MKGVHVFAAVALALGLAACAPPEREREPVAGIDTRPDTRATQTTVTGCVAEQNNQFMLTQVQPVAPVGETTVHEYQLVGHEQELRGLVGQRVQVMGEVPDSPLAERRDRTPGAIGTTGEPGVEGDRTPQPDAVTPDRPADADRMPERGERAEPYVDRDATTLTVASITPVTGECPADTAQAEPRQ